MFKKKKKKIWVTPGGQYPMVYEKILFSEPHVLIAGATGSGKSVLINSLLARLLMGASPAKAQLVLIDPKKVELNQLRRLPHCIGYADNETSASALLQSVVNVMMSRYVEMQDRGIKKYDGSDIYVIIDEYADLIVTNRKGIEPLVTRIVQLGRAANIHLIVATQRPTRDVISGAIRVNLDCKIALHTATAQDSRNIINQSGAETLPRFGNCFMLSSDGLSRYMLPPIDNILPDLISWWNSDRCQREI